MGYGMMNYGVYNGGGVNMFFDLLFAILLIAGIYFAIKWLHSNTGAVKCRDLSDDNPLEIIKKRYAKGDISREDFEQYKKDFS